MVSLHLFMLNDVNFLVKIGVLVIVKFPFLLPMPEGVLLIWSCLSCLEQDSPCVSDQRCFFIL